jgi:hypothetical protein
MKAKFKGTCAKTGAPINVGDEIRLDANRRAYLVDEDTPREYYKPKAPSAPRYIKGRGYV